LENIDDFKKYVFELQKYELSIRNIIGEKKQQILDIKDKVGII